MFRWMKWCFGAILTAVILFLACKLSVDLADEARRIIGVDTCNYRCNEFYGITDPSICSDGLIIQQVQSICNQTEDMALQSIVEIIRGKGE